MKLRSGRFLPGEFDPVTEVELVELAASWPRHKTARVLARQLDVLRARSGAEGRTQTLAAIAQRWGVTKERVRQVEAAAIRRVFRLRANREKSC